MNYLLAQLLSAFAAGYGGQVLAARNRNDRDSGWVQILVFVILAIFYALGSIVKARANKAVPKGKEQTPDKPVRKPPELSIDLQRLWRFFGLPEEEPESGSQPQVTKPQAAEPQVQPPHRKVARFQPAGQKQASKTEEAVKIPTFGALKASKIAAMEPQVQRKSEKVLGLTVEAAAPAEIPEAEYLSGILSDYNDPEKLRRVILHYEILGKPISLRAPSEYSIGF